MERRKISIILDTNLWISFLISNDYKSLDKILFGKAELIFSRELLEEFIEVVSRPKFQNYFSAENIRELLDFILEQASFVDVKSDIQICRDTKDNFLLSLAKDSQANYLITGDKDLLVLKSIENTKILSLSDFLTIMGDI